VKGEGEAGEGRGVGKAGRVREQGNDRKEGAN
jgi:hypothetical protein